jgi:hypothetical protein
MSLLTLFGLLDPLNISNNANATDSPFQYFDEYIARGSGWTLKRILHMEVYTMQHIPIGCSSYFPLPDALQGSKSIVNIKNQDQKCFLWSVLAAFHPVSRKNNPNHVSHYTSLEKEMNMKGLLYPVHTGQIDKFEMQNDVSVNVIGYEDGDFFPVYVSKHRNKTHNVDLFYLTWKDNAHCFP